MLVVVGCCFEQIIRQHRPLPESSFPGFGPIGASSLRLNQRQFSVSPQEPLTGGLVSESVKSIWRTPGRATPRATGHKHPIRSCYVL